MDDSPIPRCNYKSFAVILCFVVALTMAMQAGIDVYTAVDSITSVSEYENIGITCYIGAFSVPNCCCAFFALKYRQRNNNIKIVSPPPCSRYSKILNC